MRLLTEAEYEYATRAGTQTPQMRNIKLFAVAAAMTATGFGVWAASTSNARVAPSVGQVDQIQVMRTAKDLPPTAKDLPTIEFADHTFVFPH